MSPSLISSWLPWTDRQGRFSGLRAAAFALVLVPALLLAVDAWMGQLGSKPWTQAVHDTGTWAVRLLLVTLAVSPLRRILDWGKLIGIRRMLGLSVLAYALGHLALYCIDLAFDWGLILSEIVKRFYLLVGITALVGLVALGMTSTDGMIRRMGAKRWQRLHNLIYVITMLGLLHFALQSKIDVTQPALVTGLFALLMVYRGLDKLKISLTTPVLIAAALATGLATALCETAWYALATGVSAWMVFQANADFVVYQDLASVRPGHWVALAGLTAALAGAFRRPKAKPARRVQTGAPARAMP
ncbi:sulfite oxidase heme-binding subunit YedZ [Bosea sp. (in: a-proteobacteria)]|jgi:sulfoxide reductase heme-binding subunit YedZ|uniref:sulfite oxidase heme-binding subunit YedZ n=1 Tax=Bosea sp. (in: a-proteobacteria) TaxID=1871050 RepID=UPI00356A8B83